MEHRTPWPSNILYVSNKVMATIGPCRHQRKTKAYDRETGKLARGALRDLKRVQLKRKKIIGLLQSMEKQLHSARGTAIQLGARLKMPLKSLGGDHLLKTDNERKNSTSHVLKYINMSQGEIEKTRENAYVMETAICASISGAEYLADLFPRR